MKIKYVWHETPDRESVYNTAYGYIEHRKMCRFIHCKPMTKKAWEDFERKKLAEKHAKGLVLSYEIIEEED